MQTMSGGRARPATLSAEGDASRDRAMQQFIRCDSMYRHEDGAYNALKVHRQNPLARDVRCSIQPRPVTTESSMTRCG